MGELYQARDARSTVKRSTEAETRHAEPSQGRDLSAVFCVVFVAVVLVNQTLQLSDAAARLHPIA